MAGEVPVGYHNITFKFLATGSVREATFQLGIEDTTAPANPPSTVVEQVRQDFRATGCPAQNVNMSSKWTFTGCIDHYQAELGTVIYEALTPTPGTSAVLPCPSNAAVLVRKNTGLGGRRNRGRIYCPPFGLDESAVDQNGDYSTGAQTILNGQWAAFLALLATHTLRPVIFHSEAPFTPAVVTGFNCQTRLATQRRRMRK